MMGILQDPSSATPAQPGRRVQYTPANFTTQGMGSSPKLGQHTTLLLAVLQVRQVRLAVIADLDPAILHGLALPAERQTVMVLSPQHGLEPARVKVPGDLELLDSQQPSQGE